MASDPNEFRRQATQIYEAARVALAALVVAFTVIGWFIGGLWGLTIGLVLGGVLAGAGYFVATFLWAMSQDGA